MLSSHLSIRSRLVLAAGLAVVVSWVLAASASAAFVEVGVFANGGSGNGGSGSGAGELLDPGRAVVHQESGLLLVVDGGNDRVQVFSPDGDSGVLVTEFGSGVLDGPSGLAVDQDTGAVYVSDTANTRVVRFVSDGQPVPSFAVDGGFSPLAAGGALAFDQAADELVVADPADDTVKRFDTSGAAVGTPFDGSSSGTAFAGLLDVAVDSTGDIVVVDSSGDVVADTSGASSRVERFDSTGQWEATLGPVDGAGAVTVDPDGDRVIVAGRFHSWNSGQPPHLSVFATDGSLVADFDINATYAITSGLAAVGNDSSRIYAVTKDPYGDVWGPTSVRVIADVEAPAVDPQPATDITASSATVNATVDAQGYATSYRFDYRLQGTSDWTQTPDQGPIGGDSPTAVEAELSGLEGGEPYEYRIVATNVAGTTTSDPATFQTSAAAPEIAPLAANIDGTSAWLKGSIDANNQPTTYWFEYGTTTQYGNAIPTTKDAQVGGGNPTTVSKPLHDLQPNTTYHYRLIAQNQTGTTIGDDRTFTTSTSTNTDNCPNAAIRAQQNAQHLPDCRAYEQVSPSQKHGYDVGGNSGEPTVDLRSSADGSQVAYATMLPLPGAASGSFAGLVAQRGAQGWNTSSLLPVPGPNQTGPGFPGADGAFLGGSRDQRVAVYWNSTTVPYGSLEIRRADGSRQVIARATAYGNCGAIMRGGCANQAWFEGISSDGRHVVFTSNLALVPGATPTGEEILYEWIDDGANGGAGTIRVVSRTNDQELTPIGPGSAGLGAMQSSPFNRIGYQYGRRNAVSADGSRIFFQSPAPTSNYDTGGPLYVRQHGETTATVSAPDPGHSPAARVAYLDAAEDGAIAYFWADGQLTDEASPAGGIYRYGVASDELTFVSTAEPDGFGGLPSALASPNGRTLFFEDGDALRIDVDGSIRTIMDSADGTFRYQDDGCLTANLTPDGRYVVFVSKRPPAQGLYRYDVVNDELERLVAFDSLNFGLGGACLVGLTPRPGALRVVSDDGSRVAFETTAALVSADANGDTDVYLWENGEVSVLSDGTAAGGGYLAGADATADSVFFITQAPLGPDDGDTLTDLYVARVNGGFLDTKRADCEADACQGHAVDAPPRRVPSTGALSVLANARSRPRVTMSISTLSRAQRARLARGLAVGLAVRVNRSGRVRVVGRARIGGRLAVIARATRSVSGPGRVVVRIRLNRRGREAAPKARLRVVLTARLSGEAKRTISFNLRRTK